jgi:ribosome-associated toxin RatA of RatAB toxin-antitoxin module
VRIEQVQLVRAPREQVFEAWTDCEAWPRWDPVVFTRVTVTERTGNTVRINAETKFMGLKMPRTEKHVLTPPEKVEVLGGVPNATNTTVWVFESVPEGTLLTAVLDIQFKGLLKLLQPLAAWQVRTALPEWMRALARHVESQHPNRETRMSG